MAWIHLHLWSAGYRHLHVIGPMFLVNFGLGVLAGLAEVAVPERLLTATSALGCLLCAATLVSLAVSINSGLFGFHDYLDGPFVRMSVWVEVAGAVVLAATGGRNALTLSRR